MSRDDLQFARLVKDKFYFLCKEYQYAFDEVGTYYVKMSNGNSTIEYYHEKLSYEMYIVLGLGDIHINLYDFRLYDQKYSLTPNNCVTNAAYVDKYLSGASNIIKAMMEDNVFCDHEVYKKVNEAKRIITEELLREETTNDLDRAAQLAMKCKDYNKVIDIYENGMSGLTDIQRKRLEVAKKRSNTI